MGIPLAEQSYDLDLMLFAALRDGDSEALGELMLRHDRLVRSAVFGVLGRSEMIDDVVQKVWIRVWRHCRKLEELRSWKSWLYRMARNAAIDAGRKATRRKNLWERMKQAAGLSTADAASVEPVALDRQPPVDPHHAAVLTEQHQRVLVAIEAMPAIYREPFVLRHQEEYSYQQIAELLGIPIDTVGTRLVRARRLLKQTLESEMG